MLFGWTHQWYQEVVMMKPYPWHLVRAKLQDRPKFTAKADTLKGNALTTFLFNA